MPEEYTGIKFEVELKEGKRDTSNASELIEWCRALYQMGLASGFGKEVAGNISCRTKRGFLITPSGQNFSKITIEQLVEVIEVNEETHRIKALGIINPSSEAFLHAGIYNARKDVNAILHGHNKIITAHARELGIVETGREQPYGTVALRNEVLKILDNNNVLQMKNHGFITLGASLEKAGERARELCKKANERIPK